MISEADAMEAARHLAVCRERLSKLDKEDVEFKSIARDMDDHAWRLACFAVGELARREAERVERAKPIDAEWCLANGACDCGPYMRLLVNELHLLWHKASEITRLNGTPLGVITTRGQLLDLLAALKGGAT